MEETLEDILNENDEFVVEDMINQPSHYTSTYLEPIEVIEAWELGFHLGNAVKYVARHGLKPGVSMIEDLQKAVWYINRYIDILREDEEAAEESYNEATKIFQDDFEPTEEEEEEEEPEPEPEPEQQDMVTRIREIFRVKT